jgi:broad specificity phosphatase PhoE
VNSTAQHDAPPRTKQRFWLVRHGETEWSASGRHTSRTDLPLTEEGRRRATEIGRLLPKNSFSLVLTSPMLRAMDTCRLAGYGDAAQLEPNLREWDYGEFEGRTSLEILAQRPGWSLWRDGFPGGESLLGVAARAQAVIDRALHTPGDTLLFGHGHILRVLACCWLGLPPESGALFALGTAAVTTLGYEHENRVVLWLNGGLTPQPS